MNKFISRIIKLLLEYSNMLELNAQDNEKNTALHLACEDGNVEVVKLLLEAGANKEIKNKLDKTPIEMAKPDNYTVVHRILS